MTVEVWPERDGDDYTGGVIILAGYMELTDELKLDPQDTRDLRDALESALAEIDANEVPDA